MHYLLRYQYVEDIDSRRAPYRDAHLVALWEQADAGRVVVAGAAGDPVSEGIIVWDVEDPAVIHAFAETDPYMVAGLITAYDVVPWNTVVGAIAANPLRP